MKISLLQLNFTLGDVSGNFEKIRAGAMAAKSRGVDLVITSELSLLGYPPQDLLSMTQLTQCQQGYLKLVAEFSKEHSMGISVGYAEKRSGTGKPFYNTVALFDSGTLVAQIRKRRLPNYDIFEEDRFFEPWVDNSEGNFVNFRGKNIFFEICEDAWDSVTAFGMRDVRTYAKHSKRWVQQEKNADLIVMISASPYWKQKQELRSDLYRALSIRSQKTVLSVNQVGANDEIIFDGDSQIINPDGEIVSRAKSFEESWIDFDDSASLNIEAAPIEKGSNSYWENLHKALVLGTRDYCQKTQHSKIILGLSGGIDSALVAKLAAEAVGPSNVLGLFMPTQYTEKLSFEIAKDIAHRLKIEFKVIELGPILKAFGAALASHDQGLTHENLQSRIRGNLLMAHSNAEARLLLATGNKAEFAMGYSTLYGDTCGALCPIGDLYKTEVFGLCHFLNRSSQIFSDELLRRAPTAELKADQKDTDSLPDYSILDALLFELLENQFVTRSKEETWDKLLGPQFTVKQIKSRILKNEFKRNQCPPILKVHERSFGRSWRFPIVAKINQYENNSF